MAKRFPSARSRRPSSPNKFWACLPGDVARIEKLFARAGPAGEIQTRPPPRRKKLFAAMLLDKKVSGGEVKFVLAEKIGRVKFGCKVPAALIAEVLNLP